MRLTSLFTGLLLTLLASSVLAADATPQPEAVVSKAQVLEEKAAEKDGPTSPVPKSETITKSEAQAVDPAGVQPVDDALVCLSRTIYWEAKGGSDADMEGVASVVLNRLGHEGYPDTICAVVKQGVEKKACQFSWWCDGRSDQVKEDDRYAASKEIARKALNQQLTDRTKGAMYFHDRNVKPDWASEYIKTAETGKFLFYKPRDGKAK
ncbi:cell wall hydrolase [Pseudomonas sp. NPDC090203]|jgi:spore germination cell wall hydrolase CwlJ-like protein|uniref:cell wall hydrolase n=1 Tax=Pseudomonas TaxID=286 RepID=UPI0023637100|nr:cell wall hydrolase [Pseudomonas putida]MDD1967077.1 cell wall hydrolase [Pseudomonas putida]